MRPETQRIARFALLTALTLILGWIDRMIPDILPGIKLGLANTVLVYAVYTMDWKSSILLMLTKVLLSGLLFQSMSVILYSLAGGVLSLAVMLLVRRKPEWGALAAVCVAAAVFAYLRITNPQPKGSQLWILILVGVACAAALIIWILIRKGKISGVSGTSLAGAVAHNTGQILVASFVLNTPQLLMVYLPILVGIGGILGFLTGIVADRVLKALKFSGIIGPKESKSE